MYISSIQAADGQEVAGSKTEPSRPPETEETTTVPVTEAVSETETTEPLTDENGEVITEEATDETEETSDE